MKKDFSLSVVMPIYNAGKFLRKAVDSVRLQTFKDFECILCDASTDGSSNFLRQIVAQDQRFVLIRQQKTSLAESIQEGLLAAKAPLIARMDADDISLPHRFAVQMATMAARPDLVLLGSAFQYIDEDGTLGRVSTQPSGEDIQSALLWGCPFLHPSVMFRREAVLNVGGYRSCFIRAEDYDLWLRLQRSGKLDNLRDVLVLYRLHTKNSVIIHPYTTRRFSILAQAMYFLGERPSDASVVMQCFDEIPIIQNLCPAQRLLVLARMLACNAHLIGDAAEDLEGKVWLEEIQAALPDAELEKALAIYHMRCLKRYLRSTPCRGIHHFLVACRYDPHVILSMFNKFFRQHLRRLISK